MTPFIRNWLLPRVVFWVLWTAWLWCLQAFLLSRWPGFEELLVLGPPLILTWLGSRLVRNSLDTPSSLFWKGAAVSCALGAFVDFSMRKELGLTSQIILIAAFGCAYLGLRGKGVRRVLLTNGELVERTRAIAWKTGVSVGRVVVFSSPRNTANAFAHRMGTIMVSDRLLRVLSRHETDAVIAHETAHLRPGQRMVVKALPPVAGSMVLALAVWPAALVSAPFLPIASLLLWRAVRRLQEYDADSNAISAVQDPEALITALTRISVISGVPMHWGRLPGLFLSHPPMTDRFRAIARKANISAGRVEELVSLASATPSLPGYPLDRLDPILSIAPVTGPQTA